MALRGNGDSIYNESLDSCVHSVVGFCLLLARQIARAIIMTNAKQKNTISRTIPQTEESESIVLVGVLIAIVELYESAVTDKPELITILVPKSSISREEL